MQQWLLVARQPLSLLLLSKYQTPSLTFRLAFWLDFFSSFHCSLHALLCALADCVSLAHFLFLRVVYYVRNPPPRPCEQKKKMTELWVLCCHYQRPSPSLYTRGQMWRRDSGEFVMSKCNIRQQAQLTEPQGTQSQLLNRAESCWTGLSSVLQCHWLNGVCVCDCVWYGMYGFWVRAFQRACECLKMNCAGCMSPYC